MTGINADRLLLAAPETPQLQAAHSAFAGVMQALMALEREVRPPAQLIAVHFSA